MRWAVLLAAGLLLLAGCAGDNGAKDRDVVSKASKQGRQPVTLAEMKEAAYDAVKRVLEGVPCEVPSVGAETSKNLKWLANVSFDKGGASELDIRGDWMLMARGGFALVNISNPLEPYLYSEYVAPGTGADIKFSPDNMTAILGAGWGVELVDIRDPFNPTRVSQWRFDSVMRPPSGMPFQNAHMLYSAAIAGQQWVFVAPNSNTGVWILKMVGPPEKRTLEFVTQTLPIEGGPLGPHDMYVTFDADLKKWLLYSADGFHGWTVFDVTNPAMPTPIGGLDRPETG